MKFFNNSISSRNSKTLKVVLIILLVGVGLYWDIAEANKLKQGNVISFETDNNNTLIQTSKTTVAIVRSDDSTLTNPTSISDAGISYTTVEQMVRKSLDLIGGIQKYVKSGNTVLLKTNLVQQDSSGSGGVTDVRVVKALVKIIDEVDHGKIKILAGDGSPRPYTTFEKATGTTQKAWTQLFDVPGYQILKTEMLALGIDFRITNLNGNSDTDPWSELTLLDVPGGGSAQPQGGKYFMHQDVINADVYISVPVLKIHDPGITCALKNQIGIAPSTKYGFNKMSGVLQDNYQHKLIHYNNPPYAWSDKEIVDLSTLAKIKLAVVDAIACLETQKTPIKDANGNITNRVRMNCIVAGSDPVAVDHVCSRLIGLNPDDVEHITLGERKGLGTNNPNLISIVGADLDKTKKRFKKSQSTYGNFGQSNREWLLNGKYDIGNISDPLNYAFIANEATVSPIPGKDGWTASTYFINDKISLGDYYGTSTSDKVVSYLFSYFYAPADQTAELWIGSDDPIKVYVNDAAVYTFNSTRTFSTTTYLSETTPITIKKGLNKLLVKAVQKSGYYDFTLNICDVESDVNYRGNRVWGLKFIPDTSSAITSIKTNIYAAVSDFKLQDCYPNPFNNSMKISVSVPLGKDASVCIYDMLGKKIKTLSNITNAQNTSYILNWNGTNESGTTVASGSYIVTLIGNAQSITAKKILLMK